MGFGSGGLKGFLASKLKGKGGDEPEAVDNKAEEKAEGAPKKKGGKLPFPPKKGMKKGAC